MFKDRIIPCLDVKDGRVVKGVQFVQLRDAGDPVEAAAVYDRAGADELCFLDITASHERRDTMLDIVARTADQVFLQNTFEDFRSGGVIPDAIGIVVVDGRDNGNCARERGAGTDGAAMKAQRRLDIFRVGLDLVDE